MRRWLLDRINGLIDTLLGLGLLGLVAFLPVSVFAKVAVLATILLSLYGLANLSRWTYPLKKRKVPAGTPAELGQSFVYELPADTELQSPISILKTIEDPRGEVPPLGRNDPCWCGSGKKYKKCHGA